MVAGLGADRLSSITAMRFNDRVVQSVFDRVFQAPMAPAPPRVSASETNGAILLNWGWDPTAIETTEERIIADSYTFEGYTVYQLPLKNSRVSEGVRIATFDRVNGRTIISEEVVDQSTGLPTVRMLQNGSDSGIRRSLRVTADQVNGTWSGNWYQAVPLKNGQEYHFAVTAYNVNMLTAEVPVSIESDPVVVSVKPRIPFGQDPVTSVGETLAVAHTTGNGVVRVTPLVLDPYAGRGDSFRITFRWTGVDVRWTLTNRTRGTVVVSDQSNLSGDDAYPIVDGALVKVNATLDGGLVPGMWGNGTRTFDQGTRMMTWVNGDGLQLEEFDGAVGWEAPVHYVGNTTTRPVSAKALVKVLVRFAHHAATAPSSFNTVTDDTSSYAYRFLRQASQPAADPSFAPWIVNVNSGYRFQDYRISMPLAAYDIDANPPQRLAVGYLENNTTFGLVDGYYWPPYQGSMPGGQTNTATTGPREWLFVMKSPYSGAGSVPEWQDVLTDATIPIMYTFTWTRRFSAEWVPPLEVSFTPRRFPDSTDAFDFVIPAPLRGRTVERASSDRVGVFPNPYYAQPTTPYGASTPARQFVTFNNLPQRVTVRVFNLGGHLVRTLRKDDASQFLVWDLENEDGWLVASGMYLCHVELPDLGVSKVLKLGVISAMEGER